MTEAKHNVSWKCLFHCIYSVIRWGFLSSKILFINPKYVNILYTGGLFHCYRKNSKNWDTLNYYRDCPTNVIVGFYSTILRSKDADRITNRVDTDQTAPQLGLHCLLRPICPNISNYYGICYMSEEGCQVYFVAFILFLVQNPVH